jgi:predicted Ser/Thr protein kinase
MLRGLDGLSEAKLAHWIEDSLATGEHCLARGYQGQTLLYRDNDRRLVIKVASGRGIRNWISTLMLRHEARVYEKLTGFPAAPRCYGLLRKRYLVLEYIDGAPARYTQITNREAFFAELLELIKTLHARGVAHSDLQKKDNLLLVDGQHPCLLDFGAAVIRKPGFAPFNHFHYRFAERLDFNQWAKLKYQGRLENMSTADRVYYRRSRLEKLARSMKRLWRTLRT